LTEPKIVNLDDAAKAVEITVGGKMFKISRITIRGKNLYTQYRELCEIARIKIGNQKTELDGMTLEEFKVCQERIKENAEELAEDIIDHSFEIIKIILEGNGYEYSREWWEDNVSYENLGAFISSAILKDEEERVSQKKEMAS
jgi:hypothetical protein